MATIKCSDTEVVTTHRILGEDLNEHHTLFGGRLLSIVDAEASIAAARLANRVIVTASMDHVSFAHPFKLEDVLEMHAYVTGFGKRSIEVFVKVIGEHLLTGERFVGFTCFMTFVVADHEYQVPYYQVLAETSEQEYLVSTYQDRQALRKPIWESEKAMLEHLAD